MINFGKFSKFGANVSIQIGTKNMGAVCYPAGVQCFGTLEGLKYSECVKV